MARTTGVDLSRYLRMLTALQRKRYEITLNFYVQLEINLSLYGTKIKNVHTLFRNSDNKERTTAHVVI